jgi:protein-S-isoprenylcysteine O-methyltransferase Ste14
MSNAMLGKRNPLRLLMHIPVPWVFILAYLIGVSLELALRSGASTNRPGVVIAGGAVFLVGAIIAGWSLIIFHRNPTTTVPGRTSAQLVTWGPYRMSRNPMYVGLVLAYIGEAGLLQQAWPLVMLPLTVAYVNWIVIPIEEAKLLETFGAQYEQYRAKVRRWL